jgi:hypothetical protein
MLRFLLPFVVLILMGCATPIEVLVLDHDTGKPVPRAEVRLLDRDWLFGFDLRGEGVTDSEGVARLRPVLSQIARIDVRASGMRHLRSDADLDSGTNQRWEEFLRQARSGAPVTSRWIEYVEREEPDPLLKGLERIGSFVFDAFVPVEPPVKPPTPPAEADRPEPE